MTHRFQSFPYNETIWVVSIPQMTTKNPDDSVVFSNQFSKEIDLTSFDFSKVTTLIIGTGVSEVNAYGDHTNYLKNTISNCEKLLPNLENIYLFYTTVYFEVDKLASNKITTIHIPYFLLRSTLTDLSQFKQWDVGDKRAICMTGDIRNRVHKFQLLYYFYLNGNLDALNYSLMNHHYDSATFFSEHHLLSVISSLNYIFDSKLDLETFKELYQKLSKDFPNDENFINRHTVHRGLGIYTHLFPDQWNDASCNLVLETVFYDIQTYLGYTIPGTPAEEKSFLFTEKMWKPILSGKPFIAFSSNDAIYDNLEKMGFRTFLKYTNHPKKITLDRSIDSRKRFTEHFKICYDRTLSFLDNIDLNKESIIEDINFNLAKWKEVSQLAWDDVYKKCPPAKDMTRNEFCEIFNWPVHLADCSKITKK